MSKIILIALVLFAAWLLLRRSTPKPKPAAPPALGLDEAEARAILGVDAGASDDAIRAAHRRLAAAVHPDRGGSTDLTRRINAARDTLLRPQRR